MMFISGLMWIVIFYMTESIKEWDIMFENGLVKEVEELFSNPQT